MENSYFTFILLMLAQWACAQKNDTIIVAPTSPKAKQVITVTFKTDNPGFTNKNDR